jgi:hypothetical protein
MHEDLFKLTINLILGMITGLVVALVTTRLSLRRFYSERWWERTFEAYAAILEALYDMKRYTDDVIEAFESGRELSDEWRKQLHAQWRKGSNEVDKATAIGAFIISGEASRRLAKLKKELGAASLEESWFGSLDSEAAALRSCIDEIKDCAKRDLGTR